MGMCPGGSVKYLLATRVVYYRGLVNYRFGQLHLVVSCLQIWTPEPRVRVSAAEDAAAVLSRVFVYTYS